MPTRNINLTDRNDGFISDQLAAGHYKNASEVVRAGLRLLERREAESAARLEALRDANALGMQAYENGDYVEINTPEDLTRLFADIDAEIDAELNAWSD